MKVFISYSRDDARDLVAALRVELEGLGHVWLDKESMSNRGGTFLHEIQCAIESADRMVLVWGETAPRKDHVEFEWQHARDTGKIIVPLLIGVDPETLPEELRWFHAVTADPNAPTACFDEVRRLLKEEPLGLATLVGVPSLPPHFRARHQEVDRIRKLVFVDKIAPGGIDGPARATVLHGMGGIGKSVLAAAFAHSYFTRRHLKYIYWLDGRDASHQEILERLAALIGVPDATADRLQKDLHGQAVGVIIDDAGRRHAETVLDVLDRAGRVLVTTRDASEIAHSGMNFSPVDLLSEAESLDLLANWVGEGVRDKPYAEELVRLCGGLPLAIALNAGMLRGPNAWSGDLVVRELKKGNLEFATGNLPGRGHESISRALEVSFSALADLGPGAQQRAIELTAFIPEEPLPLAAVARLWQATDGLEPGAAEDLAVALSLRSFIRLDGARQERTVGLHNLVRAFLEEKNTDAARLNRVVCESFNPGWNLPPEEEGYSLRTIVRYLLQAGDRRAVHKLLTTTSPDRDNAWYTRLDRIGRADVFAADVRRLHGQTAKARAACPDNAGKWELLADEHLYSLISASVASLAAGLGPELLPAIARASGPLRDDWPPPRVLSYALALPRPDDRGAAIAGIWDLLPDHDRARLGRFVPDWIAASPFPHRRANSFATLLRQLDASRLRLILREISAQDERFWRAPDSFIDPRWEITVAGAVRLADLGAIDEAVDMIMGLPEQNMSAYPRHDGIEAIAGFLPGDACRRVLEIEGQHSPESRAWSTATIAGRLAALNHVDEALELVRTVEPVPLRVFPIGDGPDALIQAYRNVLAPEGTWLHSKRVEAERKALELVDAKSDTAWGVSAACIAGVLRAHDPGPLLERILDFEPQHMSLELYLAQIAPFLPEPARRKALLAWLAETASQRNVLHGRHQVSYIRWLVPLWSLDDLEELRALIGGDVCLGDRWEFDLAVAARQGGGATGRLLRRVIRDRMRIGDEEARQRAADAFRGVEPSPPADEQAGVMSASECRSEIHEVAQLWSPSGRAENLERLLPSITAHWTDLENDVLDLITGLTPRTLRAQTALVVATALKTGFRDRLVALAETSLHGAASSSDEWPWFPDEPSTRPDDILSWERSASETWKLLPRTPLTRRAEIEALESSQEFRIHFVADGKDEHTNALRIARLADTLDEPEKELTATALLQFARSLGGPHRVDVAAVAILRLPRRTRSAAADELRGWAGTIDDDLYGRAVAFAAAAVVDPPEPRWNDVRAALQLLDALAPLEQVRVIEWLTTHRSAAVFEEVLDAIEELPQGQARAQALEAAILNDPPGSWGRLLRLVTHVGNPEVELLLLREAITVAPEPLRTKCRVRVSEILGAMDLLDVETPIRKHVIELLPALWPLDAPAALGFLWQSLTAQPRSKLLDVFLTTAPQVRDMSEELSNRFAGNVDQTGGWWP